MTKPSRPHIKSKIEPRGHKTRRSEFNRNLHIINFYTASMWELGCWNSFLSTTKVEMYKTFNSPAILHLYLLMLQFDYIYTMSQHWVYNMAYKPDAYTVVRSVLVDDSMPSGCIVSMDWRWYPPPSPTALKSWEISFTE